MTRKDIDLRYLVGQDVLDQGSRPTCVTFASSAAHEALRTAGGGRQEHLAPEALWWQATHAGVASYNGMVLGDVAPALDGHGQPVLFSWPYNPDLGAGTEDPPIGLSGPPWKRAQLQPLSLAHDGVEEPIETELAQSHPVILIVEVTDEFHLPDEQGIVNTPNVRATAAGYHAVACVGVATHPSRGRLLLIKNSWGPSWGLGGYCWLPIDYVDGFAVQAATII